MEQQLNFEIQGNDPRVSFLAGMRRLVLGEAKATRERIQQGWSRPVPRRVADGLAIEGLRVVQVRLDGDLELVCFQNHSRFREGDTLCLNRGNPFEPPRAMVTLESDEETRLLVSLADINIGWGELLTTPDGWVVDEGYLDLSHYFLDALDEVADSVVGRERVLPLLMGRAAPKIVVERWERGMGLADSVGLNWSQAEAFANAYAADLAYCIQGPPGTGKTRVLAHLASALAEDGERVLVTAFTHRAINNALNKLAEVAPDTAAIKIGRTSRADDLAVENHESFDNSPMAAMKGGYVIGATPFAPRTRRLGGVEFETVIFDEASQITLPLAVMGMLSGKKFIFIGDQRQLPPVLTARYSGGAFRDSVFGALAERGFDTMLTDTYRLSAELVAWPSRHFYQDRLVPVEEAARRRIDYTQPPARLAEILDPEAPKVFVDLGHHNVTTRSHKEAGVVVDLIETLLACGVAAGEIGVVAPYRAQGREIRNLLRQVLPDAAARKRIVVDTVERMQGQERDVVIVSLTTSNPTFAANLAEFFFQPERLNVAVTRPRKKLILVGSRHVLKAEPEHEEWQQAVALFKDLLDSCAYFPLYIP
ncbi:MAG: AAA family ATPase [Anaerolineales bacterium]|nr:AAA family ATPase [Anaerolineales bacterium]